MKKTKSQAGKLGADKTHRVRYEMLEEARKFATKEQHNYLLDQPTETIRVMLDIIKKNK
jgi:hypothetical protein